MIIPKEAIIAEEKIRDYLLIHRAKNDKSKFLGRAGYTRDEYWELIRDIRALLPSEAEFQERKRYGTYYAVRGILQGPDGTSLAVKTIWILDLEGDIRFVTLVPDKEDYEDEI
jgi:hypothetical protein